MKNKPTAVPKRGRPALQISDEERVERLATQRAAANARLRERVVYASVPLDPKIAAWIDEMRANERPIPGRGPFVAAILEEAAKLGGARKTRK